MLIDLPEEGGVGRALLSELGEITPLIGLVGVSRVGDSKLMLVGELISGVRRLGNSELVEVE